MTLEDFSLFARRWLPPFLWMGIIFLASTDWGSGSYTFLVLRPILLWINPRLSDPDLYDLHILVRKAAHVIQFAVLAVLIWKTRGKLRRPLRREDFRLIALILLIAGFCSISSEVIQLFFPKSRGASLHDVYLDMGGALLGVIFILAVRSIHSRPSFRPVSEKILITADLHLDEAPSVLDQFRKALQEIRPDLCVVAGDIGTADQASRWLRLLKEAAGRTPLAICLGNHDHWLDPERWNEFPDLASIREKIWRPAARAAAIPCLDFENLELRQVVITGGYGHFDFGLRDPSLAIDGVAVTPEDYLAGTFAGLHWRDMTCLPHAVQTLQEEAKLQAETIADRLTRAAATGKSVLLITHTVPFPELIGHDNPPTDARRFFNAYAGNSLVGKVAASCSGWIRMAICGHTHFPVSPLTVHGISCANVGSDYGALRFLLFDSSTGKTTPLSF